MIASSPSRKNASSLISDSFVLFKRNALWKMRTPQLLVLSLIQPLMILVLFNYVFGGAIGKSTSVKYIDYLLPGMLIQTTLFGALQAGIGLAQDLSKGAIDRFRSLPIARSAVLSGRAASDVAISFVILLLVSGVGTLLGFRFSQGIFNFVSAIGLALLFGFAMNWLSSFIGLMVKDPEAVQAAGFMWVFPLTFASAIFSPVQTMPEWLQVFARNQPVTQVVNAVRHLTTGGIPDGSSYVWHSLLWIAGITIIFMSLSVWRYRKIQ
jgi:ABC transporter DrrB family efflux protein